MTFLALLEKRDIGELNCQENVELEAGLMLALFWFRNKFKWIMDVLLDSIFCGV